MSRHETPRAVRCRNVIEVTAIRGAGLSGDPVREVYQYWSESGALLAEHDPCVTGEGPSTEERLA